MLVGHMTLMYSSSPIVVNSLANQYESDQMASPANDGDLLGFALVQPRDRYDTTMNVHQSSHVQHMLGDYLYKPPNLYLGLHGYVLGCVHICTCIYVCGCLNIVFQVFRCNYLYMKHLDLVSKLNINVVLKRNFE